MDVYYLITLNSVKTGTMSVLESSHIKHSINVCFKNYYCGESLSMGRWQDEKKIHAFSILFFFFLINLFIYFWLRWVFIATHGLSLVVSGDCSSLWCAGFSLRSTDSRCAGFSSCGARA